MAKNHCPRQRPSAGPETNVSPGAGRRAELPVGGQIPRPDSPPARRLEGLQSGLDVSPNDRLRHMLIGYTRVSKTDGSQSLDLQRDALRAAGVDDAVNLYHGLGLRRPRRPVGPRQLLAGPAKGRRARRLEARPAGPEPRPPGQHRQDLSARGVGLRVLAGQGAQVDTTTAAGRLVFGIFAALAEFERELIRERTVAGLKAARARGRKGGRKFALDESSGAAGPGRDGAPRHVGFRAVPGARHQAGDALPVRPPAGPAAGAGPEGPRLLNRHLVTRVGLRPAKTMTDTRERGQPDSPPTGPARVHPVDARPALPRGPGHR